MKRWIRRILLGCSIGLLIGAIALRVRGFIAVDFVGLGPISVVNTQHRLYVTQLHLKFGEWNRGHPGHPGPYFRAKNLLPYVVRNPFGSSDINFPHWLLVAVGGIYPSFLWLRQRSANLGRDFRWRE